MTGTQAGRTAGEIARRHREKIARLERSAAAWEAGAAGERATGAVLDALVASGWTVMHDLAWPGREKANLDHVVVGPGGVFVIDTKNWSGTVEVRHDVLRQNGRPRDKEVAAVAEAALAVQRVVPDVPVHPVLCLCGEGARRGWVRDVMLCSTSTLRELLDSRPAVLTPPDVQRVRALLGSALGRRSRSAAPPRAARPPRSSRRSGASAARLVGFVVTVALLFGALTTGLFTSAAQTMGDYIAEVVTSDSTEPPGQEKGPSKKQQRRNERRKR